MKRSWKIGLLVLVAGMFLAQMRPQAATFMEAMNASMKRRYRLVLFGGQDRQDLATFTAGVSGTAIVQTFGPLKLVGAGPQTAPAMKLEIRTDGDGAGDLAPAQSESKN